LERNSAASRADHFRAVVSVLTQACIAGLSHLDGADVALFNLFLLLAAMWQLELDALREERGRGDDEE